MVWQSQCKQPWLCRGMRLLKPELTKEDINLSQDRFSFPFNTKLKFNFFSKY